MCDYDDLVDDVATHMLFWYEDYLSDCYDAGTSTLSPKEYVVKLDSMEIAIEGALTSKDAIMCVVTKHISNPWNVMKGCSPDYDGTDAYHHFWKDCAEKFYEDAYDYKRMKNRIAGRLGD